LAAAIADPNAEESCPRSARAIASRNVRSFSRTSSALIRFAEAMSRAADQIEEAINA
jgi:hypothetical protein